MAQTFAAPRETGRGHLLDVADFNDRLLALTSCRIAVPRNRPACSPADPETDGKRRSHGVRVWGAAAAITSGLCPPIGGAVVHASNWRWVFLVNVPLGVVAVIVAKCRLAEDRAAERRRVLDLREAVLLAAALALITLGLVRIRDWGWASTAVVGSFVADAIAVAVFVMSSGWCPTPRVDAALLTPVASAGADAAKPDSVPLCMPFPRRAPRCAPFAPSRVARTNNPIGPVLPYAALDDAAMAERQQCTRGVETPAGSNLFLTDEVFDFLNVIRLGRMQDSTRAIIGSLSAVVLDPAVVEAHIFAYLIGENSDSHDALGGTGLVRGRRTVAAPYAAYADRLVEDVSIQLRWVNVDLLARWAVVHRHSPAMTVHVTGPATSLRVIAESAITPGAAANGLPAFHQIDRAGQASRFAARPVPPRRSMLVMR